MGPLTGVIAFLRKVAQHRGMAEVETIGQRIRRERLARQMTQRDLASRLKVGVPHVSKVEAGRENPSDELLRRVADVFELDPDELFLVARRVPETLIEQMAIDPAHALSYLRRWNKPESDASGE